MIKWILSLTILIVSGNMSAQQIDQTIAGEYYLQGVMETASGFKLNSDSTFQFFFSYGALDRSGQGRWSWKDSQLEFNSRPHPGKDFVLKNEQSVADDYLSVKIIDNNQMLLPHIICRLKAGDKLTEQMSDQDGIIRFPKQPADSIILIFEFCPERSSAFFIGQTVNNYFEFGFEPWLMEVFFQHFILTKKEKELMGKHPLMDGANFHYKKNQ